MSAHAQRRQLNTAVPLPVDNASDNEAPVRTATPTLALRPYQRECVDACVNALREGWTRIGVSAPTGSGKTAMFTALVKRLAPLQHEEWLADRVLILVGSVELARQAAQAVSTIWPDLSVEIEQGRSIASGLADVTVATYQTLATNKFARLAKFDPDLYKAVVVDEAHHASARSYLAILSHFNSSIAETFDMLTHEEPTAPSAITAPSEVASSEPAPLEAEPPRPASKDSEWRTLVPILGFTATFGRADGKALGKVFEKVVWHAEWLDMIKAGWLSELHFTTVRLGKDALDLDNVDISSSGEFVTTSLSEQVSKKEVTDLTVRAWLDRAQNRRSTLVFAVTVNHINALVAAFRERGIDARYVYEGTPPKERQATLDAFKAGEFPVLVNCGILTEGADVPSIDCILLARPTRSQNLFLQMLGRGLRLSPQTGKENCLVIDLVGASTRGAMNTPTLFGIDPDAVTESEMTSEELDELSKESQSEVVDYVMPSDEAEVMYRDFVSFDQLVLRTRGTSDSTANSKIRSLSRLAWVSIGDDSYVVEVPQYGYLKVMRSSIPKVERSEHYVGFWYGIRRYGDRMFRAAPVEVASRPDLAVLIRTCDAWLATKREELFKSVPLSSIETRAGWRAAPLTKAQEARIEKAYRKVHEEEVRLGIETSAYEGASATDRVETIAGVWVDRKPGERVEVASLTRGEASDVLSRLKHGSLALYRKQLRIAAQKERKRQTELKKGGRRLVKSRLASA